MTLARTFVKVVAALFVLNTIYPTVVKGIEGRLAGDWLHGVLHLVTAVIAAYVGWRASDQRAPGMFALGLGLAYPALGVHGLLRPGLFLGTPFAIPLHTADNVFHLLVGIPALIVGLVDRKARMEQIRGPSVSVSRSM